MKKTALMTLAPGEEVIRKKTADRWRSPEAFPRQIPGKLILTNQRLIFLSSVMDFSIPYDKIREMKKSIIVFFPMGIVLKTDDGEYELAVIGRKSVMQLIQSKMREHGIVEDFR